MRELIGGHEQKAMQQRMHNIAALRRLSG